MKKNLFYLLMLLLVSCTTIKEDSKYHTYIHIYEYNEKNPYGYSEEAIKLDSIINDTPVDVVIKDGIVQKPQDHPEFNTMSATMPDGKIRNARRVENGFKAFAECRQAQRVCMYNQNISPLYSDDINFGETSDESIKDDGSFYKYMMIAQETLVIDRGLFADIAKEKEEPIKVLNEAGNDFYINGIPAMSGKDAVLKELEQLGFVLLDEITECDLTILGEGFTYYANYVCESLDEYQANRLTGGLFEGLKSPVLENGTNRGRVFLQWYKSGIIKKASIELGWGSKLPDEDALDVNKRLLDLFGNSKVGSGSLGYMIYYNDHIESYYTNGKMLSFERRKK